MSFPSTKSETRSIFLYTAISENLKHINGKEGFFVRQVVSILSSKGLAKQAEAEKKQKKVAYAQAKSE
jgi:hypothetical protein